MTVNKASLDIDFNETALDDGRRRVGARYFHELRVYVSDAWALQARQLQAAHGFDLIVMPLHLTQTPQTWGCEFNGCHYWSRGVS